LKPYLENYIFPILNKNVHQTNAQITNRIHKITAQINDDLKEIGKMVGIDIPLSTYVARHTYASVLKRGGASVAKISQALFHTNLKTTQIYLKDFSDEEIDKMNEELLL
jgi:site-specific recombinase XerD